MNYPWKRRIIKAKWWAKNNLSLLGKDVGEIIRKAVALLLVFLGGGFLVGPWFAQLKQDWENPPRHFTVPVLVLNLKDNDPISGAMISQIIDNEKADVQRVTNQNGYVEIEVRAQKGEKQVAVIVFADGYQAETYKIALPEKGKRARLERLHLRQLWSQPALPPVINRSVQLQ